MDDIDPITGLPVELSDWDSITQEDQFITVSVVKRRFGKLMTVVTGFDTKAVDGKQLAKKLKAKLACGGTFKDGAIELQGAHSERVKAALVDFGFNEDQISVKATKFKKGRR